MIYNLNEIRLRVNINVALERVYSAWSTSEGLESWFLRRAIVREGAGSRQRSIDAPIGKGDLYTWYWHGYPDSLSHDGEVLEANGKDRFAFSFSLGCPVRVTLSRECGETIVELSESGLPTDEDTVRKHYLSDSKGWVFYLTNLKSVLEGGLDLRNRKVEL